MDNVQQLTIDFNAPTPKLCECGCGKPTPLAKKTNAKFGHKKGEPLRCIFRHKPKSSLDRRFWAKVQKTDSCWLWTGTTSYHEGKVWAAHRLAYTLLVGPVPDGLLVCHRCDVRNCVNPDHLFLGTYKDNSEDMVNKGRQARGPRASLVPCARGERHGRAKVTEQDVRDMRRLHREGVTLAELSRRFGIGETAVAAIVHRKHWVHVED
jgi:hypothetical protein